MCLTFVDETLNLFELTRVERNTDDPLKKFEIPAQRCVWLVYKSQSFGSCQLLSLRYETL